MSNLLDLLSFIKKNISKFALANSMGDWKIHSVSGRVSINAMLTVTMEILILDKNYVTVCYFLHLSRFLLTSNDPHLVHALVTQK